MNTKKIFLLILLLISIFTFSNNAFAGLFSGGGSNDEVIYCDGSDGVECNIDEGVNIVTDNVNNVQKDKTFFQYAQDMLIYVMGFVALLGVIYIIYAGFIILNANGDDSKVKKSKSMITFVILGIIVMFVAYPIINWVLGLLNAGT